MTRGPAIGHYRRSGAGGLTVATEEEVQTLTARLKAALGADVGVACSPLLGEDDEQDLFPEEAVAVERAVPKRVREFATGRQLARRLLGELGFAPGPLPARADRSPRWPPGAVGAITHTKSLCIVVAARGGPDESLGVDVEPRDDLSAELHPLVCTNKEMRWLAAQPADRQGRLGKALFSAKETLYKCQHPLTATFLGFHQAEVELDPAAGRFDARILHPVAARLGDLLTGTLIETDRWIVTAMRYPARPLVG